MLYVYHFQPDSLIDNTKTMQKGFETDFDQWSFGERSKGLVPNCPITDFALLTGHKGLWGWPSDHKHLNSYEHWTSRNTHQFSIQSQFSWTSPNSIDIFDHITSTSPLMIEVLWEISLLLILILVIIHTIFRAIHYLGK